MTQSPEKMNHQKMRSLDQELVQENDLALGVGQRVGRFETSRQDPAAEALKLKVGFRGPTRPHSR